MSANKKVFLCTMSFSGSKGARGRWTRLDDRGWVEGETPVEDFGAWFACDSEVSDEGATRILLALMAERDGEMPECGSMPESERLFRSHHLPVLLEPYEYDIFTKLIQKPV